MSDGLAVFNEKLTPIDASPRNRVAAIEFAMWAWHMCDYAFHASCPGSRSFAGKSS
jgi:hypothetical protein